PHPAVDGQAMAATAADEAPRSAMGRVMGIMIEALRQEALRDDTASAPSAGPTQVIEVGAAFRLDAGSQSATPDPAPAPEPGPDPNALACDVQPCERGQVPNLRIASQK